ncbi:hypothetical protein [Streptomyces sp. NPDC051452]|uniref:hypothetical protein n=1 Tax=Streptomyces sp. NPDC051452 TaxID=3365654 RepID=UPI003795B92F
MADGHTAPELLDSYQAGCHSVGRSVPRNSGSLYDALRGGRCVLITPEEHEGQGAAEDRPAVERRAGSVVTTMRLHPGGYVA